MMQTHLDELPGSTRERLLAAAREVFAECGFKGATVREICRRAEVNVAAVNYHFKSKDALFVAALELEPVENLFGPENHATPAEERLARVVRELMLRMMDADSKPQHSQLLMCGMLEPSPALDSIAQEIVLPLHRHLGALVNEIAGGGLDAETVRRCVFSIVGQCLYYRNSREMNRCAYPELHYDAGEIDATARHIAQFSIAGIRRLNAK